MKSLLWLLCVQLISIVNGDLREAWCPEEAKECRFTLFVDYGLTMMAGPVLTKTKNGALFRFDANDTINDTPISRNDVITADGYFEPRLVMTYNGTIPGPALHVRRGQAVRLTVINNMMHETTTVHIHGQYQRGTPYSDGVPFVTQCPVLPGQTFVQNFQADPSGTFFYHSHSGPQLTNGLYGPFIVHPSLQDLNETETQANSTVIPGEVDKTEHILVFQDWNHDWDSNMVTMKMRYGLFSKGHKLSNTKTLANISYSAFEFQSGIINGRGRFYDESGTHNGAPLSEFSVVPGKQYRFRLINAGDLHPFRVSIDSHDLLAVATDGHDIQPVLVESLIINPGERYDFILAADQPVGNYWIRGHTLQVDHNHTVEAILRYAGAPLNQEPTSDPQKCTSSDQCIVLNCPFSFYPAGSNTYCYNYDKIRSLNTHILEKPAGRNIKDYFLNFAFPGRTLTPGSVNGKSFTNHEFAALSQSQKLTATCSRDDCGDDQICHCPYTVSYDHGDLIQFVFTNIGSGQGWDHPVHMHGHSFQVVKVGFPSYNETTGTFIAANKDIDCGFEFCNHAKWADASWNNGNIPDTELTWGPLKDDIIVPSGGYVVARIKADNPGLWIIHCHLELHMTDGMAALLNESHPLWPSPPPNFPTCGNFYVVSPISSALNAHAPVGTVTVTLGAVISSCKATLGVTPGVAVLVPSVTGN